jgi:hypothetical protein
MIVGTMVASRRAQRLLVQAQVARGLPAPAKPDGAESEVFQLGSELDALLVWVARIEACAEQAQAVDISRHAAIISFTWCAQPGALGRARHVFASPCD